MAVENIEQFIKKIHAYRSDLDEKRIRHAFEFVEAAHKDELRRSGDPFVTHPLRVADILLSLNPDEDTIIASLLHDVSREAGSKFQLSDVEKAFGPKVARMVDGLEKLSHLKSRGEEEEQIENLRKMFLAMAQDLRVVLIRLADRLHNMETLQFLPAEKQKRIARETLYIYAPIASRLGIYHIKGQLEDLSFKFLHPVEYESITRELEVFGKQRGEYINQIKTKLTQFLQENAIPAEVQGRFKSVYSIYRKLKRKNKASVTELFDIFAMRIVLETQYQDGKEVTGHLYQTLGLLHSYWIPLANRFKDYVAMPKPNGYQSLHTTVIGLAPREMNHPVEVQICSEKMHREAEYGVASHWLYEDTEASSTAFSRDAFLSAGGQGDDSKGDIADDHMMNKHMDWLKGLSKFQEELLHNPDSQEFFENLKMDFFNDRIFVLTPTGEVKDLPLGATPVDFAYAVHSNIGHRCAMAKVNGSTVPLDYPLKNGEVVEIILKPKPNPKLQWLSFIKTNTAKGHIKSWFRGLDRDLSFKEGKEMLNKNLRRLGKAPLDEDLTLLKNYDGKQLNLKERRKVVESIGDGSQFTNIVIRKMFRDTFYSGDKSEYTPVVVPKMAPGLKKIPLEESVLLGGQSGLPVRFPACCSPKEHDPIVGYITRGRSAAIHKKSCQTLLKGNPDRILDAAWISDVSLVSSRKYRIKISVEAVNRVGLLRDITTIFAALHINIVNFSMKEHSENNVTEGLFYFEIENYDQLEKVLSAIENVNGVLKVVKEEKELLG